MGSKCARIRGDKEVRTEGRQGLGGRDTFMKESLPLLSRHGGVGIGKDKSDGLG